jgi:hypothetical protein
MLGWFSAFKILISRTVVTETYISVGVQCHKETDGTYSIARVMRNELLQRYRLLGSYLNSFRHHPTYQLSHDCRLGSGSLPERPLAQLIPQIISSQSRRPYE